MRRARAWTKRLVASVCIVAALMVALPFSQGVSHAVQTGAAWQQALDPEGQGEVDAVFQEEVLDLREEAEMRASEDGLTVGFTYAGAAAEAFGSVRARLEAKGWSCTMSGLDTCATFTKEQGSYRWLFVSCTAIGGESSVVLQCAKD
ncbi:MAG: hypothetical protein Q4E12_00625 [Coriobacteriia bacterium]|nr:hypothetical protein [Coriobacteriia bacterium]